MLDRRIGPQTQRFAVLGESLSHSWSPYIHNSLFAAAGMDAVYVSITVPENRLGAAADVFRSCFSGFNVTIPYKEKIIPYLDEVDDAVRACGAVNTVEVRDGRLTGHITDGLGMLRAIEEGGVGTDHADVMILGGGGAARVAGYEFLVRGGRVTFAVRDTAKGKRLCEELAATQADGASRLDVCALPDADRACDILINCTPVGMYPHAEGCPASDRALSHCKAVFDAVYNPRETQLLARARARGIPCIEGLGMLFYQAVEAQKIWFGQRIAGARAQSGLYRELLKQM